MYLRIANKGLADPSALVMLGVSSARHHNELIGQFGTGAKFGIALLLRNHLEPTFCIGNLKMHFTTVSKQINGDMHKQIIVKFSGKDLNGKQVVRTEKRDYTTGLGEMDWDDVTMAPREFTSNALDGAKKNGTPEDVIVDTSDNIRAKNGWTQVFIPLNNKFDLSGEEIIRFHRELSLRFLQFHPIHNTTLKLLPKVNPSAPDEVRIYKKGVLVACLYYEDGSKFDYNLGDELSLDESRNAKLWDVKAACARAWLTASKDEKEELLLALTSKPALWESTLDADYMDGTYYAPSEDAKQTGREGWKDAFESVHGEDSVACTMDQTAEYVVRKGRQPVTVSSQFKQILRNSDAKTEDCVLTTAEKKGRVVCDATPEMIEAVNRWWKYIVLANLHRNKQKPEVKGFQEPYDAGGQTHGLSDYVNGVVYLRIGLGGLDLREVALHELGHHCTDAADGSTDFVQWAYRLATLVTFGE